MYQIIQELEADNSRLAKDFGPNLKVVFSLTLAQNEANNELAVSLPYSNKYRPSNTCAIRME